MAIALVQHKLKKQTVSGTTCPITVTSTTNKVLTIAGYSRSTRTITGVTDNIGNNWLKGVGTSGTGEGGNTLTDCWFCLNATSGVTTITVQFSGTAGTDARTCEAWEWSGFVTPTFDTGGATTNATGSGTTDSGPTLSVTGTNGCSWAVTCSGSSTSAFPKSGNEYSAGGDLSGDFIGGFASLIYSASGNHQPVALDGGSGQPFTMSAGAIREGISITFLEPGGDADFNAPTTAVNNGFWGFKSPTTLGVATDFVHGSHIKSLSCTGTAGIKFLATKSATVGDTGGRATIYIYLVALPTSTSVDFFGVFNSTATTGIFSVLITTAGVLQLWTGVGTAQIGTNGSTLSTGQWYRLSIAYTISSTTVNTVTLWKDGVQDITTSNNTLTTGSSTVSFGRQNGNTGLNIRYSDIYVDNSSSLTDTGNVWVTAKRPNANGTTNGFTTQIGSGGSGYGTGHSPQVNERPLSTTNGWSMVGAGSAITEEYNIEGQSVGDIDLTGSSILGYVGWVSMSSLVGEIVQIIVNSVSFARNITSTSTLYTQTSSSTSYPASTGTDIGVTTDTSLTTVSLYECGILVAFIPAAASTTVSPLSLLGAG